jgi:hypothetical protein
MIIEFLPKHSLNFGEDFEYIDTYVLGKSSWETMRVKDIEKYRILVKGVKTGKEKILYLETQPGFFGRDRYQIGWIDDDQINHVDANHIRNESTNEVGDGHEVTNIFDYYRRGNIPKTVEDMFSGWRNSDPMIHNGNMTHSFLSKINNYRGSYRFNQKTY